MALRLTPGNKSFTRSSSASPREASPRLRSRSFSRKTRGVDLRLRWAVAHDLDGNGRLPRLLRAGRNRVSVAREKSVDRAVLGLRLQVAEYPGRLGAAAGENLALGENHQLRPHHRGIAAGGDDDRCHLLNGLPQQRPVLHLQRGVATQREAVKDAPRVGSTAVALRELDRKSTRLNSSH